MKYLLLLSLTFTTFVNATFPVLARRQTYCLDDAKECGDTCIGKSDICCPAPFYGGCKPGEVCDTDSDGNPSCCPIGKICTGTGGGFTTSRPDEPTGSGNTEPSGTASNNAGAIDRIDGTVGYLVAGAVALLL